jgi:hypothetical protein
VNATTRFYIGFFFVLALVIAVAYYAGLRAGVASVAHEVRTRQAAP